MSWGCRPIFSFSASLVPPGQFQGRRGESLIGCLFCSCKPQMHTIPAPNHKSNALSIFQTERLCGSLEASSHSWIYDRPTPLRTLASSKHLQHSRLSIFILSSANNRAPSIVISAAICIFLAITAVLLRLLARRLSRARILADDYMMIFAMVS